MYLSTPDDMGEDVLIVEFEDVKKQPVEIDAQLLLIRRRCDQIRAI
jgi:hypothetical protein